MPRVIDEIRHVGLYDLILQDVQKLTGKEKPDAQEVEEVLKKHPAILRDYMQTTVEYNLSNIHLRDIDLESIDARCRPKAKQINENLARLRELEKYTLDFEQSSTLVLIFSVEFFVLFSVQYFIVLLDLKAWQWWIYGLFALSILAAWLYARKMRRRYEEGNAEYARLYEETLKLIASLEEEGELCKEDLYISESDEHI
jgi:ABC-type bacteriocin/lantibiotic exporter with double-glycine peptidase domain